MRLSELRKLIREEIKKAIKETSINELEDTANAANDVQVAKLNQQKADKEKQAAIIGGEIAKIKQQIDAIEKK
jgi:hypothetical protein